MWGFKTSMLLSRAIWWLYHGIVLIIFDLYSSSSIWRNILRGHAGLYRLSRLNSLPRSLIVNPCYGGTVRLGLEPMAGMLLSRSSWRLYHGTALIFIIILNYWFCFLNVLNWLMVLPGLSSAIYDRSAQPKEDSLFCVLGDWYVRVTSPLSTWLPKIT